MQSGHDFFCIERRNDRFEALLADREPRAKHRRTPAPIPPELQRVSRAEWRRGGCVVIRRRRREVHRWKTWTGLQTRRTARVLLRMFVVRLKARPVEAVGKMKNACVPSRRPVI